MSSGETSSSAEDVWMLVCGCQNTENKSCTKVVPTDVVPRLDQEVLASWECCSRKGVVMCGVRMLETRNTEVGDEEQESQTLPGVAAASWVCDFHGYESK